MGLPKLSLYHYAFCLRHLAQWTLSPERVPPPGLRLNGDCSPPSSL
ncbi:hypothetical protein FQN60_006944 [Etheostoma spectabile]|uniref:Uncharacterized protein n=1 Tax=Etheostoma spectabile TaxID=54343 RepID=A0A5J5CHZ9_9PERO|nr:hypothetical protein FQN60_006944 [Etheostoma spectabile]